MELTHDNLTSVARRSRDARVEHEAGTRRRRQRTRLIGLILGLALLVAGVSVPLAVWALREKVSAQKQEKKANDARDQADGLINFMLYDLRDKLQPIGRGALATSAQDTLNKLNEIALALTSSSSGH